MKSPQGTNFVFQIGSLQENAFNKEMLNQDLLPSSMIFWD